MTGTPIVTVVSTVIAIGLSLATVLWVAYRKGRQERQNRLTNEGGDDG